MGLDPELAACAGCLCLASRRTARTLTRLYDDHLRPHGLRITQFSILTMLGLAGPLPMATLADRLDLERSTLSRGLARLAAAGWVDLGGARKRLVALTPAGRAALLAAKPAWEAAQAAAGKLLGPEAARSLMAISGPPGR
jgi:DNA-binding MarR family transcriptional regulator